MRRARGATAASGPPLVNCRRNHPVGLCTMLLAVAGILKDSVVAPAPESGECLGLPGE